MDARYRIADTSAIYSPALLFYKEIIAANIARMVRMAGGPDRLRPHAKTHKCPQIARMELAAGITKHKCATIAEADMLADAGAPDILIAYPLIGPNCDRLARLIQHYPHARFSVLADHPSGAAQLSAAMTRAGTVVEVVLDLNVGQNRTGIAPGAEALKLYESLAKLPGLCPGGLQVYDGHNNQEALSERQHAKEELWQAVLQLRDQIKQIGLACAKIIVGGTPMFPVYANVNLTEIECSPGTCVLHDHGYGSKYPDLGFVPAALLLTRVVSRPTPNRVTLDLGYKAVSADPPAGNRALLLDMPEYKAVLQNEEHLVIETAAAAKFQPGDEVFAIPTHVCPTVALHKEAYVTENSKVVERWPIVARDRFLHV